MNLTQLSRQQAIHGKSRSGKLGGLDLALFVPGIRMRRISGSQDSSRGLVSESCWLFRLQVIERSLTQAVIEASEEQAERVTTRMS